MYLSFKDLFLGILKALILTSIIVGLVYLGAFDYHLGISYCNIMNIPKDLALSINSPGMATEVGIVLFVLQMIGLYFATKLFKRFDVFNNFCEFLSLDY